MTFPTAPEPPKPEGFRPQDHVGDLVYVFVFDYEERATTPWGVRPQVSADVTVLDGREQVGQSFSQIKLSGKMLAPQLGQIVGKEVYGRLAARPGSNVNPAIYLAGLRPGDEKIIENWQASLGKAKPGQPASYRYEPDYDAAPTLQPEPDPELEEFQRWQAERRRQPQSEDTPPPF